MTEPSYRLPEIPYLRLRVTLRAEEPARLPGYTGSMLRGAFGHALRRAVCAMGPRQPCASCSLRRECVYPRLFETLVEGDPPPFLKGLPTAPRPYVFEPAEPVPGDGAGPRDLAAGEALGFDLLLFGRAVELQAYALLAIERMAEHGLGSRRRRFVLERVETPAGEGAARAADRTAEKAAGKAAGEADGEGAWQTGYLRGERRWESPVPAARLRPERLAPLLASGAAELHLRTPLRLTADGPPSPPGALGFDFRKLAFRTIRRALEIAHFHVPEATLDWHFKPMLRAASHTVRLTVADLRWHDWHLRSDRLRSGHRVGGRFLAAAGETQRANLLSARPSATRWDCDGHARTWVICWSCCGRKRPEQHR